MGSCTFEETHESPDVKFAHKELVAQARIEYGCDPYSGTIAAADYHVNVVNPTGLMSAEAARQKAEEILDQTGKYDPISCIRIGKASKTKTRTVTRTLTFKADNMRFELTPSVISQELGLENTAVEVIEQSDFQTTNKIVKNTKKGESRKRWALVTAGRVKATFATKTEAKAALADEFANMPKTETSTRIPRTRPVVSIRPIIDDPAEEFWTVDQTVKVKVKVKITEAEDGSPMEFDQLLFFGWAPC